MQISMIPTVSRAQGWNRARAGPDRAVIGRFAGGSWGPWAPSLSPQLPLTAHLSHAANLPTSNSSPSLPLCFQAPQAEPRKQTGPEPLLPPPGVIVASAQCKVVRCTGPPFRHSVSNGRPPRDQTPPTTRLACGRRTKTTKRQRESGDAKAVLAAHDPTRLVEIGDFPLGPGHPWLDVLGPARSSKDPTARTCQAASHQPTNCLDTSIFYEARPMPLL
jgi:hypothetical protein